MDVDQFETMSSGNVSTVSTGNIKRVYPTPVEPSSSSSIEIVLPLPKRPKVEAYEKKKAGFSKYKSLDLMTRIVTRLENSDRQMATRLLREFESEHLPTLPGDSWDVIRKLIEVALLSKYDQISLTALRMALCAMRRADLEQWMRLVDLLIASEAQENALSNRAALDSRLLLFFVEAMERDAIDVNLLPRKVQHAADRSLCSSNNTQRRIAALQFQVTSGLKKCRNSSEFSLVESMLCRFCSDRDSRVRRAAVDGLFLLCQKAAPLTLTSYSTAVTLMKDSNRGIRLLCIQILLEFANRMPDQLVNSAYGLGNETQLRLCDDAFSVICNAINDMEVSVRTEAAVTLGKLEHVSDAFLDQTLDKKLMATLKTDLDAPKRLQNSLFAISKHNPRMDGRQRPNRWSARDQNRRERQREAASEWSRGKELHAPAPQLPVSDQTEDDAIIPQGACGAFVSALEDEFMSVRRAAVYSLGKLAAFRPSFAITALDHLADMFNDEISEVRLDSIRALTPLIVHGQLTKEQLEVILKCLDDAMPQSRQAMRDLLSKAEFADSDCLKLCTKSLLNCLQRFPNDKEDIYKCFSCIGRNHGVQVHAIVTELLDLEPVFEPQERPIDDVFYIAKLILVLNGASVYEPITALLPKYVVRHYFFLRSSSPNLVEPIKAIDENGKNNLVNVLAPKLKSAEEIDKQTQENAELMERTYERLRETETELHSANRNNLRRLISQDVNAIAEFNSLLSGSCRFVASLCSICASCDTLTQIVLCGTNDELADIGYLVEEEQRNLLNVEHQFSHIPPEMSSFLIECRFFIRLLAACAKLGCDPNSYAEVLDEIADELEIARAGWSQCQCSTSSNGVSLSNAIEQHISAGDSLAEVDNKKILTFQTLSGYLNKYSPIMPNAVPDIPKIQAKWAEVIEPNKDRALETVVKFVAGLPRSIPIIAQLHNLTEADLAHLHIMIEYPDETVSYYRPRNSEFERKPDQHLTILNTKAMLSSPRSWLSSAEIRLMFVLLLPEPIKSALTPVPLFDSPTKARFASVRLRMLPSDYVTEMDIRLKERIHRNQQLTQTHAYEDLIAYYRHQFPHNDERCQNSSEMEKLHFDIVAMYEEERQPKEEFLAKMKFRQDLYDAIKEYTEFEEFEIYPSGSSITSMGTRNSDLDLTLVCPMAERFYKNEQDDKAARSEGSFNVLRIVRAILLGTKYSQLVQSVEFVCGNIPILKMVTREGLECDLAFTSDPFVSSLHNSHLLRHYCLLDERFAQLTALVKKWASATGVKNPKGGGFNSYGLTLLVLHFMHCGVYPPVLPNLQSIHPDAFAGGQVNPEFIDFSASLSDVSPQHFSKGCQREKNYDLVSTLFVKFLFYYANFDFKLNYIDIPAATRRERNSATYRRDYMTRDEKGHTGHVVCIQDPFDGHNPGRTVRHLDAIKLIFNKTLELFISGNVPALQQIISMRRFNE